MGHQLWGASHAGTLAIVIHFQMVHVNAPSYFVLKKKEISVRVGVPLSNCAQVCGVVSLCR